jgi:hypothetical protein
MTIIGGGSGTPGFRPAWQAGNLSHQELVDGALVEVAFGVH